MKLSDKVRTWLADRSTVVGHPRLYRKPAPTASRWGAQPCSLWDALLALIAGVVLIGFGLAAFVVAVLLVAAIVTG